MKRKLLSLSLLLAMLLSVLLPLSACAPETPAPAPAPAPQDIVILFTNDVHGAVDADIGYAGLAAYRNEMKAKTPYVTLVDCGDHTQGSYIGAVSRGAALVEIMNGVGYDFATLGNHEFDFGIQTLADNITAAKAHYLCCNLEYTGKGTDPLKGKVAPYEIVSYGDTKVGYIGIATPLTPASSTLSYFMEDGEMVYDFGTGEDNARFIARVQEAVDACRAAGAQYVVALSHLGMDEEVAEKYIYSSVTLVSETTGIDVLLDGHSHTVEPCRVVKNKAGVNVPIAQTGTGLENFGQLVISAGGVISVGIVTDYEEKDAAVTTLIEQKTETYKEQMNQPIGHSNVTLSCSDENGVRLVRSRETAIGNFVADAYRLTTGADIGLINGGGVRANLDAGDVTFGDLIAVNPYGNSICVVEVTGQELLDMFEYFCRLTLSEYTEDGRAIGEDGSFQQVSGLRFTVDTSIASSVTKDADETFLSVGDDRRIKNMEVLKDGVYTPIDPAATYTIASTNYLIKNGGCGMGKLLAGHRLIVDEAMNDYQLLADYLTMLNGDLSAYATVDGRITVE